MGVKIFFRGLSKVKEFNGTTVSALSRSVTVDPVLVRSALPVVHYNH